MDFYARQTINRRRTWRLMAVHAGVFACLGLGMDTAFLGFPSSGPGFPVVTPAAVLLSLATSWFAYYRGDRAVLQSLLARPLDMRDAEHRQLGNIVQEIALAAGVPVPAVYVIPDNAPNALAIGRDPAHAAIALTSGALVLLDREETQGVVAHEMAHVASGDTAVMTMVGVLFGGLIMLADWSRRMLFFSRLPALAAVLLAPPLLLLALIAPALSRLMATAVAREREYHADAVAVRFTRNPLGLARALRKIERTRSPLRGATQASAHFFLVNPLRRRIEDADSRWADLFATHPPIASRIALLEGRIS